MKDRFSFRAWNKKEKKYIDDIQECDNGYGVGEPCRMCFGDYLYECETYEVEQCTGLKDKNGKLIYEGDIVRVDEYVYYSEPLTLVIAFRNGAFMAGDRYIDNNSINMKIIGNIHENPELLGVNNEK